MGDRTPWLDYLIHHIGVAEIPGPEHNPLIVAWGREAGIDWWNNDEDAWCAVAVNGALVRSGFPSTKSALARSFTRYGTRLREVVRGAIVVFPRGSNPLYGHVGIVETVHGDGTITVVNGNVANKVKRSRFRVASVLPDGIRWPPGVVPPVKGRPHAVDVPLGARVLALGSRGADVVALQRNLNVLGYDLAVDGEYGGRTRDAVRRFQARRDLLPDGKAGPATLSALTKAVTDRAKRTDKRTAGAKAAAPVASAGAAAAAGMAITQSVDIAQKVRGLGDGTALGLGLVMLVLMVGAGVLIWRMAMKRAEGPAGEDA